MKNPLLIVVFVMVSSQLGNPSPVIDNVPAKIEETGFTNPNAQVNVNNSKDDKQQNKKAMVLLLPVKRSVENEDFDKVEVEGETEEIDHAPQHSHINKRCKFPSRSVRKSRRIPSSKDSQKYVTVSTESSIDESLESPITDESLFRVASAKDTKKFLMDLLKSQPAKREVVEENSEIVSKPHSQDSINLVTKNADRQNRNRSKKFYCYCAEEECKKKSEKKRSSQSYEVNKKIGPNLLSKSGYSTDYEDQEERPGLLGSEISSEASNNLQYLDRAISMKDPEYLLQSTTMKNLERQPVKKSAFGDFSYDSEIDSFGQPTKIDLPLIDNRKWNRRKYKVDRKLTFAQKLESIIEQNEVQDVLPYTEPERTFNDAQEAQNYYNNEQSNFNQYHQIPVAPNLVNPGSYNVDSQYSQYPQYGYDTNKQTPYGYIGQALSNDKKPSYNKFGATLLSKQFLDINQCIKMYGRSFCIDETVTNPSESENHRITIPQHYLNQQMNIKFQPSDENTRATIVSYEENVGSKHEIKSQNFNKNKILLNSELLIKPSDRLKYLEYLASMKDSNRPGSKNYGMFNENVSLQKQKYQETEERRENPVFAKNSVNMGEAHRIFSPQYTEYTKKPDNENIDTSTRVDTTRDMLEHIQQNSKLLNYEPRYSTNGQIREESKQFITQAPHPTASESSINLQRFNPIIDSGNHIVSTTHNTNDLNNENGLFSKYNIHHQTVVPLDFQLQIPKTTSSHRQFEEVTEPTSVDYLRSTIGGDHYGTPYAPNSGYSTTSSLRENVPQRQSATYTNRINVFEENEDNKSNKDSIQHYKTPSELGDASNYYTLKKNSHVQPTYPRPNFEPTVAQETNPYEQFTAQSQAASINSFSQPGFDSNDKVGVDNGYATPYPTMVNSKYATTSLLRGPKPIEPVLNSYSNYLTTPSLRARTPHGQSASYSNRINLFEDNEDNKSNKDSIQHYKTQSELGDASNYYTLKKNSHGQPTYPQPNFEPTVAQTTNPYEQFTAQSQVAPINSLSLPGFTSSDKVGIDNGYATSYPPMVNSRYATTSLLRGQKPVEPIFTPYSQYSTTPEMDRAQFDQFRQKTTIPHQQSVGSYQSTGVDQLSRSGVVSTATTDGEKQFINAYARTEDSILLTTPVLEEKKPQEGTFRFASNPIYGTKGIEKSSFQQNTKEYKDIGENVDRYVTAEKKPYSRLVDSRYSTSEYSSPSGNNGKQIFNTGSNFYRQSGTEKPQDTENKFNNGYFKNLAYSTVNQQKTTDQNTDRQFVASQHSTPEQFLNTARSNLLNLPTIDSTKTYLSPSIQSSEEFSMSTESERPSTVINHRIISEETDLGSVMSAQENNYLNDNIKNPYSTVEPFMTADYEIVAKPATRSTTEDEFQETANVLSSVKITTKKINKNMDTSNSGQAQGAKDLTTYSDEETKQLVGSPINPTNPLMSSNHYLTSQPSNSKILKNENQVLNKSSARYSDTDRQNSETAEIFKDTSEFNNDDDNNYSSIQSTYIPSTTEVQVQDSLAISNNENGLNNIDNKLPGDDEDSQQMIVDDIVGNPLDEESNTEYPEKSESLFNNGRTAQSDKTGDVLENLGASNDMKSQTTKLAKNQNNASHQLLGKVHTSKTPSDKEVNPSNFNKENYERSQGVSPSKNSEIVGATLTKFPPISTIATHDDSDDFSTSQEIGLEHSNQQQKPPILQSTAIILNINQLSPQDKQILTTVVVKVVNDLLTGKYDKPNKNNIIGAPRQESLPGSLELPILKILLFLPEVKDMAINTVRDIFSEVSGIPENSSLDRLGDNVIDSIFNRVLKNTLPDSIMATSSGVVDEDRDDNGQWPLSPASMFPNNDHVAMQADDEVLNAIEKIVRRPGIGLRGAKMPFVQRIIVRTVKNVMKKSRHAVDDSVIWETLNNAISQAENFVRASHETGTNMRTGIKKPDESYQNIPVNHVVKNGQWNEKPTVFGNNDRLRTSSSSDQTSRSHTNTIGYTNQAADYALIGESDEHHEFTDEIYDTNNMVGMAKKTPTFVDDIHRNEDLENGPIKYYTPNDRILTYIKNHQSSTHPVGSQEKSNPNLHIGGSTKDYWTPSEMGSDGLSAVTDGSVNLGNIMHNDNYGFSTQYGNSIKLNDETNSEQVAFGLQESIQGSTEEQKNSQLPYNIPNFSTSLRNYDRPNPGYQTTSYNSRPQYAEDFKHPNFNHHTKIPPFGESRENFENTHNIRFPEYGRMESTSRKAGYRQPETSSIREHMYQPHVFTASNSEETEVRKSGEYFSEPNHRYNDLNQGYVYGRPLQESTTQEHLHKFAKLSKSYPAEEATISRPLTGAARSRGGNQGPLSYPRDRMFPQERIDNEARKSFVSPFSKTRNYDPTYFGKISSNRLNPKSDSISELMNRDLFYVGDGIKIPLAIQRMPDGSYALSISQKMCENYVKQRCPCCVPPEGNIVEEGRQLNEEDNEYYNRGEITRNSQNYQNWFEPTEDMEFQGKKKKRYVRSTSRNKVVLPNVTPVEKFVKKYNLTRNLRDQTLPIVQRENVEEEAKNFSEKDQLDLPKNTKILNFLEGLINSASEKNPTLIDRFSIEDSIEGDLKMDQKHLEEIDESDLNEMMKYEYQNNNPIMKRIRSITTQKTRGPYKYQKNIDHRSKNKMNMLKNLIYWLRKLFLHTKLETKSRYHY